MYIIVLIILVVIVAIIFVVKIQHVTAPVLDSVETLDANSLSILQYNIQMRPYIDDIASRLGNNSKLKALISVINSLNADVVVLNEAFSDIAVRYISDNVNYKHKTKILGENIPGKLLNGGVIIFSKYPITESREHCFRNTSHVDSWAAKGVQYAKIDKLGSTYNILATHLNATYTLLKEKTISSTCLYLESIVFLYLESIKKL